MTALLGGRIRRVVVVVLAVHTVWIGLYFALGHEARDFIKIGAQYVAQSHASDAITFDPTYEYPRSRSTAFQFSGYDAQFSYYIALDPENARHYMDAPAYRYSRILYPAAAWALSAGDDEALPYAMLALNWLMIAVGTIAVALLLRRRGASEWWAVAYGLAPGMLIAVQRDLTEPLGYGLAAWGLVALTGSGRHRYLVAGLVFALAGLARQTTLLIPAVWALWTLLGWGDEAAPARVRLRRAVLLGALAVLPYAAWSLALHGWLGSSNAEPYVKVPFGWLFKYPFGIARQPPMVLAVVVPAVIAAACAVRALRVARRPEWAALALQVLVFVIFAPAYNAFTSVGRAVVGVVLVGVIAVPYLTDLPPPWRRALVAAAALYGLMAPVVFVYGLTSFQI